MSLCGTREFGLTGVQQGDLGGLRRKRRFTKELCARAHIACIQETRGISEDTHYLLASHTQLASPLSANHGDSTIGASGVVVGVQKVFLRRCDVAQLEVTVPGRGSALRLSQTGVFIGGGAHGLHAERCGEARVS